MINAANIPNAEISYIQKPISHIIHTLLHEAINRARRRGECQYVVDGEPCCVIGQFGALSGLSIAEMQHGSGMEKQASHVSPLVNFNKVGVTGRLIFSNLNVPDDLLYHLQSIWDVGKDEEKGREQMRSFLNAWPVN